MDKRGKFLNAKATRRHFVVFVCLLCLGCGSHERDRLLPGENYSRSEALIGVDLGKPIVDAIYRFESDTGLWPNDLAELVPGYLASVDTKLWRYHTFNHDDFALVYLGPLACGTLHFDHDSWRADAWNAWWSEDEERRHIDKLDVEQPLPAASILNADQKASKRHNLLRSRIEAVPNRINHRVGLMKHFFELERYNDAREICLLCIDTWPDYWLSYLLLAKIESYLGDQSESERRLAGLAARWDDFFGYMFLAQFYFGREEFAKSSQALQKSLVPAPTRHKDLYAYEQIGARDSWVADCYSHVAANLAYQMGDRQLCLAICDRWRGFVKEVQGYGGVEERALRIVCAVNDGAWDRATDLLEKMKRHPDYSQWQSDGIQKLGAVISHRNAEYVYNPRLFRDGGAPFRVEFSYK